MLAETKIIYETILKDPKLLPLSRFKSSRLSTANIFPEVKKELPEFFKNNLQNNCRIVRQLSGPVGILRIFYYQLLKLGFEIQSPRLDYSSLIKDIFFSEHMISHEKDNCSPSSGKQYTMLQYLKIIAEATIQLQNQVIPNIEMTINIYPILDEALLNILERVIQQYQSEHMNTAHKFSSDLDKQNENKTFTISSLLQILCSVFNISLEVYDGCCYSFEESDVFMYVENIDNIYLSYLSEMAEIDSDITSEAQTLSRDNNNSSLNFRELSSCEYIEQLTESRLIQDSRIRLSAGNKRGRNPRGIMINKNYDYDYDQDEDQRKNTINDIKNTKFSRNSFGSQGKNSKNMVPKNVFDEDQYSSQQQINYLEASHSEKDRKQSIQSEQHFDKKQLSKIYQLQIFNFPNITEESVIEQNTNLQRQKQSYKMNSGQYFDRGRNIIEVSPDTNQIKEHQQNTTTPHSQTNLNNNNTSHKINWNYIQEKYDLKANQQDIINQYGLNNHSQQMPTKVINPIMKNDTDIKSREHQKRLLLQKYSNIQSNFNQKKQMNFEAITPKDKLQQSNSYALSNNVRTRHNLSIYPLSTKLVSGESRKTDDISRGIKANLSQKIREDSVQNQTSKFKKLKNIQIKQHPVRTQKVFPADIIQLAQTKLNNVEKQQLTKTNNNSKQKEKLKIQNKEEDLLFTPLQASIKNKFSPRNLNLEQKNPSIEHIDNRGTSKFDIPIIKRQPQFISKQNIQDKDKNETLGTFYREFSDTKIMEAMAQPYKAKVRVTRGHFKGIRSKNFRGFYFLK